MAEVKPNTSVFVKSAIRHWKLVYLSAAALCALGIFGLISINKDEFPTFEINQGLVAAVYPGVSADDVETRLTKPLEEMLLTIPEIKRDNLESVSKDGIAYIMVDLNCSQKRKTEVWGKIKHKLSQGKIFLPPGVLTVQVLDDFSDVSAILLSLESDDKGWSELEDCAERLKDRLRKIDRMGSVTILGSRKEEIAVTLDMSKLSAYGINPASLMLNFASGGLGLPTGKFDTEYLIAPMTISSDVDTEEEIARRIVWSSPAGDIIRLEDIASVERRVKKADSEIRYNGHSTLLLNLVMRPDNNIVTFGEDVDRVLEEFSSTLPSSVHLNRVTDTPGVVDKSVNGFLRDLLISMLVVILVMILMFPMRSALIASSGVPVCTMVAVGMMYLTGMSLNTVTLAALIVVLGMIVDDSIITMDGYMDKLGHGMDRIDAAAASARELFMPMFMATLSICSMFFPMLGIITGYLGDFIQSFPWVVLISLMTSLVYAVTVVPSLETTFIKTTSGQYSGFVHRLQNRMFSFLQSSYDRFQARTFDHPRITIAVGVLAVLLGVLVFTRLNIQMMPFAARKSFAVEVTMEPGKNLDDTRMVADSLEKMLMEDPRIVSVTSFVGSGAPRFHATFAPKQPSTTFAQLIVNTKSEIATEEILPYAEARYEHYFPGALVRIKQMDYHGTDFPVSVNVSGPDREKFAWVADSVYTYMKTLDRELKYVHTKGGQYTTAIRVDLKQEEASRAGVDRTLASLSLAQGFSETELATVYEGKRTIPVVLYSSETSDTMSFDAIGNKLIQTAVPGVDVPLRQVADISPEWRRESLLRYGGMQAISVDADLKYGHSHPRVMKKISAYVDGLCERNALPDDVEISYLGLSAQNAQIGPEIAWSFVGAVAIMFLFLLLHFKKVRITVLSLSLSLLCLFGASVGLWAFNLDFGMTSVLGIVALIGIIVRNGIIMFEYAEELHFKEGYSVKEAAMLAGQRRMRPIFLTSCTTALGVIPMVISGDALWQPLGIVICFGIIFSILLVVFIMPVSYWKVFEKRRLFAFLDEK